MQRHPIATTWGRSRPGVFMMSMETTKRVWQARLDPRRNTPLASTPCTRPLGNLHAQPCSMLAKLAAIEEGVMWERLKPITGWTPTATPILARALARLLGFDLCPQLEVN